MQELDWNDLRHLLAIGRGGTLTAAARRLGVDETTVARRLKAAEQALGARLFTRSGEGRLQPTEAGEIALTRAEAVEREVGLLSTAVSGTDLEVAGSVRLTAVPLLVNRLLIPALPPLLRRHPLLRLELLGEPRDLSLTRREADLALRLARPRQGGRSVLARRIGRLDYGVFGPAGVGEAAAEALPWITYEEGLAALPQARWIEATLARDKAARAVVAVNDAEAVLAAVRAGLGRSLLPTALAEGLRGLKRLGGEEPVLSREIWLLLHAELKPLARIEAVVAWLEATLAAAGLGPA